MKWGWIETMVVSKDINLIDISPIFLATNLYEQDKNIDYLKIKNLNLVSHVPFISFLEAINWI